MHPEELVVNLPPTAGTRTWGGRLCPVPTGRLTRSSVSLAGVPRSCTCSAHAPLGQALPLARLSAAAQTAPAARRRHRDTGLPPALTSEAHTRYWPAVLGPGALGGALPRGGEGGLRCSLEAGRSLLHQRKLELLNTCQDDKERGL